MKFQGKEIKPELSGFREIEPEAMELIDKMLMKHSNKLITRTKNLESLHITLKQVHKREKGEIYEVHTRLLDNGKLVISECTDRNLLTAVDTCIERILKELEKKNKI